MARKAPTVIQLDDYRRNVWQASDLAWEHAVLKAVAALAEGERLRAALVLPQAESIARLHTRPDDPRRAATLTLLARWQLAHGNRQPAERLLVEADRAWAAASNWVERLRPGTTAEGQAECRRLLQQAVQFTAALARGAGAGHTTPGAHRAALAGLPADRRKLEAAVRAATASLEPETSRAEAML